MPEHLIQSAHSEIDSLEGAGADQKQRMLQCGDPMQNPLPKYDGDPWKDSYEHFAEPDRARCKAWKEEVETLLIFAGLFSAVVTAFIIESYKSLREDPADTSTALLLRIALQLEGNGTTVAPPFSTSFEPSSSNVRVNSLWFLSLILSLTTVLVGTLCLQWLREHLRFPSNPREALPLHHMQEESLNRWYVPQIFTTLPLLLQLAVLLFFIGIIDFLWQLHRVVASISLASIGIAIIFYVATTIAPTVQDCLLVFPRLSTSKVPRCPCPYRSPQSFLFLQLAAPIIVGFIRRCVPMHWRWKKYWENYKGPYNEMNMDDHCVYAHRETSWISHHRAWLLQRDIEIVFSQYLHHGNVAARCASANVSSTLTFFDNIEALGRLVRFNVIADSVAPWTCIEQYIDNVELACGRFDLSFLQNFLNVVQYRGTTVAPADFAMIPHAVLKDHLFCTFQIEFFLPPNLLCPYWFEKNLRVLRSSILEVIRSTESTILQSVAGEAIDWFGIFLYAIPETHLQYAQDVIDNLLTVPTIWDFRVQTELAQLFGTLFASLGACVARNYSLPLVQSQHRSTLRKATQSILSDSNHKSYLVSLTSYYLLEFLNLIRDSDLPQALEEAADLLALLRSHRERCLKADRDSPDRMQLLVIQAKAMTSDLWVPEDRSKVSSWKDYFVGLFDVDVMTNNTPTYVPSECIMWRDVVGSLLRPTSPEEIHDHPLVCETPGIGKSGRETVIDVGPIGVAD